MDKQRVSKWYDLLENRIRPEVLALHQHRQVRQRVGEIVAANPDIPPSYYFEYLDHTYGNSQCVGIRRLVDKSNKPVSLYRFMGEIGAVAEQITVEWFLDSWGADGEYEESYARQQFEKHFQGERDSGHLDAKIVKADRAMLMKVTEPVRAYVDTSLAHMDKTPAGPPKFREIHDAVDAIGRMFQKYYLLGTANSFHLEIHFAHDWERTFTVAWKPPRSR